MLKQRKHHFQKQKVKTYKSMSQKKCQTKSQQKSKPHLNLTGTKSCFIHTFFPPTFHRCTDTQGRFHHVTSQASLQIIGTRNPTSQVRSYFELKLVTVNHRKISWGFPPPEKTINIDLETEKKTTTTSFF